MYAERTLLGPKRTQGGVIRSIPLLSRHFHAAAAIMDGDTWAVWGGHPQWVNQRHSCGTRESERCRAASEMRAIYAFLVECSDNTTPITIKASNPRTVAQLQYWLSVTEKRELTMPRLYTGGTLRKLARLVQRHRSLIIVEETDKTDDPYTAIGQRMNRVMHKALDLDYEGSLVHLETHLPQLTSPLRGRQRTR